MTFSTRKGIQSCVAACALLLTCACSNDAPSAAKEQPAKTEVEVFVVPRAEPAAAKDVAVASTLTVEHETDLIAEEPGRLLRVLGDQGKRVRANEVLARMEDIRLRKVVEQDRAELRKLESENRQASVLVQAAEVELQRQTELRKEGLGSQRDYDRARFSLDSIRIELDKTKYEVERLRARVEEGEIRLSRMELRAPFDGIVSRRYAREGQMLAAGDRVLRVTELRPLLVHFSVPEEHRARMSGVQLVEVRPLDAAASRQKARILRTAMVVDAASGSTEFVCELVNPAEGLVPGMSVEVLLPAGADSARGGAIVPAAAIRRTGEATAEIFVVQGDRLQRRSVRVGEQRRDRIAVMSGLQPGERVVARFADNLKDGMTVSVRP